MSLSKEKGKINMRINTFDIIDIDIDVLSLSWKTKYG